MIDHWKIYFEIQMEVAERISEAMKGSLSETEKKMLAQKPMEDLRAYDFYMRARDFLSRGGKKNNESAIQMFELALDIDSNLSLAYVGLVEAYSYNYMWYDGDQKWLTKIIAMNKKALELDSSLIDAQFIRGMVFYHQKTFVKAIATFKKVIERRDDFYPAYRWLGFTSDVQKEYDAAIKYYKLASAVKPYSEEPWMHLEMTYRRKGDLEASKEARDKMRGLAERKLEVNPNDVLLLSRIGPLYAADGDDDKALSVLKRVLEIAPDDGLALYNCACTYAKLEKKKETLDFLERALALGYKNILEWINSDPDFESVRQVSGFKELLVKCGS